VIYQDTFGSTLCADSRPAGATVWLGAVPGAIFGGALDPLMTEPITSTPSLELDLGELHDIVAKQSAVLTGAASASGWKVVPSDTRIIRVATNLNHMESHRHLPNTAFIDLQSGNLLMLVYFDRPCQLSGVIAEQAGESETVDVTVGQAAYTG
jgi:hypothetical protein